MYCFKIGMYSNLNLYFYQDGETMRSRYKSRKHLKSAFLFFNLVFTSLKGMSLKAENTKLCLLYTCDLMTSHLNLKHTWNCHQSIDLMPCYNPKIMDKWMKYAVAVDCVDISREVLTQTRCSIWPLSVSRHSRSHFSVCLCTRESTWFSSFCWWSSSKTLTMRCTISYRRYTVF